MLLGSYLRGDLTNMVHHGEQITSEDFSPLGLVARALAAAAAGDHERASRSIQRLTDRQPAGRRPRGLDKFFPVAELAERLARDLARAGPTAGAAPPPKRL